MRRGNISSVADAIPFDPALPSTIPPDIGHSFSWDPTLQSWIDSDRSAYHRQVSIPDSFTISLNGTLNITTTTNSSIILTGNAANYTIVLPNATSLYAGQKYEIYNTTPQPITVKDNSGTMLFTLSQNAIAYGYLQTNGTAAGGWLWFQALIASTASGIISYNIISSTPFSTTSINDTLVTGFSVTPQAGTYGVWYSGDVTINSNNNIGETVLYKNGSVISDSRRSAQGASSNFRSQSSGLTIISFNGSEACDLRIKISTNGNTFTINQRSMLLIRLGT